MGSKSDVFPVGTINKELSNALIEKLKALNLRDEIDESAGELYIETRGTKLEATFEEKEKDSIEGVYSLHYVSDEKSEPQLIAKTTVERNTDPQQKKMFLKSMTLKEDVLNHLPALKDEPVTPNYKEQFLQKHDELFKKDKKGFFGFFRNTKMQKDWSLQQILEHAQKSNNRSRQVCVELGWMQKNGELAPDAPTQVKKALQTQQTTSPPSPMN